MSSTTNIANNLGFQASGFINNGQEFSIGTMLYKMLFSLFFVSLITTLTNKTSEYLPKIVTLFKKYRCRRTKSLNSVILVSRKWFTGFGKYRNDITNEKLAVLDHIQHRVADFTEIYRVEQDYTTLYNSVSDRDRKSNYYNVKQEESIIIHRSGEHYIRAIFDNFFDEQCKEKKEMDDFSHKKKL